MEFADSQINMAKVKRVNLQWFPIIHLAKTKIVDPHYFPMIFLVGGRAVSFTRSPSRRRQEEVPSVTIAYPAAQEVAPLAYPATLEFAPHHLPCCPVRFRDGFQVAEDSIKPACTAGQ
jgi:hypothetical protein